MRSIRACNEPALSGTHTRKLAHKRNSLPPDLSMTRSVRRGTPVMLRQLSAAAFVQALAVPIVASFLLLFAAPAKAQDSTATVNVEQVQVRSAPSISAPVVATLIRGVKVTIKGRDNSWTIVESSGVRGYVRTAQLGDAVAAAGTGAPATSSSTTASSGRNVAVPPLSVPPQSVPAAVAEVATKEPTPSAGHSKHSAFSIEASGAQQLVTSKDDGDSSSEPDKATLGFETQARFSVGNQFSVGAGFVRTSRSEKELVSGLSANATLTWSGPFVEPRLLIPVGKLDLMILGRVGLLNAEVKATASEPGGSATFSAKQNGMQYAGGVGLMLHMAPHISLVVAGQLGSVRISSSTVTMKATGQPTEVLKDSTKETGTLRVLKAGIAFGF